jgi:hypothetical protein
VNQKLLESHFTWVVVALFVLGTVIYIFPVGQIQPGHCLALVIILMGVSLVRWHDLNIGDKWLIAFGVYALIVNTYYYFSLQNPEFLSSIFYWAYNIALFIALSHILSAAPKVRLALPYVLLVCLAIIFVLWAVGFGYLQSDVNELRFIGSFNDSNQLSYWLICSFLGLYLLSDNGILRNRYIQLGCLIVIALLISAAGSRSGSFGLLPLAAGFIWLRFFKDKLSLPKPILLLILGVVLIGIVSILGSKVNTHVANSNQELSSAQDVPLNRLASTEWKREARIRGYFRPIKHPQYLLFGAGHGQESRFNSIQEIHSSFLSVFFYYGILGLVLFMGFLYQIFRRLSLPEALMLSAPFVYGLFTYGFRTPIFWVLMAIVVATRPKVLKAFESRSKQVSNAT